MRGHIPSYHLENPRSLDDALTRLSDEPNVWTPFAGGTDLMVVLEMGRLPAGRYLSVLGLSELSGISVTDSHVEIGANSTYRDIRDHVVLQREFPMLVQAAVESGAIAIQNRGTLGGNIMNASPAADSPPALLAYEAEVELISKAGVRTLPHAEFHTGYKQTQKRPDELLRAVRLPRKQGDIRHFYEKVGTRSWQAISKVCFAGWALMKGKTILEARVGLGAVKPVPTLATHLMGTLAGEGVNAFLAVSAKAAIARDVTPIDDIRSTAAYRRAVSQNLAEAFVKSLG
jgi:CO/xanthine dehydrogenase FAD-binding subunit